MLSGPSHMAFSLLLAGLGPEAGFQTSPRKAGLLGLEAPDAKASLLSV